MQIDTKYCLTVIIIAIIWLLGQPISGNVSMEVSNFDLSYLNFTNSTISGSVEISGSMPIGTMIFVIFTEIMSYDNIFIMYFMVLSMLFLAYVGYYLYKNRR